MAARGGGSRTGRFAAGQHFLRSSALAAEIVRAAGIGSDDLVLDLGAGTGVLTSALAKAGAHVIAVELDPALARSLRARFREVVEEDILKVRLPREPFRVVANLPFDCTTAALRRLLDPRVPLVSADVIVQWEVAVKRAAVWPSTQLGIEWGAWHELRVARRLPACCFAPPPVVDTAVLRATRRAVPLVALVDRREYRQCLERGFADGLRSVLSGRQLKRRATELGFSPQARPRDLDAHQWAALFRSVRRTG